jgi:hypothetical protein
MGRDGAMGCHRRQILILPILLPFLVVDGIISLLDEKNPYFELDKYVKYRFYSKKDLYSGLVNNWISTRPAQRQADPLSLFFRLQPVSKSLCVRV